jgi:hypothetical protein
VQRDRLDAAAIRKAAEQLAIPHVPFALVPSATLQRAVAFAEAILRPWRRNRYRDTDPDVRIETPEFFYHRIEHRHRFPEQSRHPIFITRLEKVVDAEKDAYVVDRVVPAALHISYKVEITIEQKRTFRLADVIGHLPSASAFMVVQSRPLRSEKRDPARIGREQPEQLRRIVPCRRRAVFDKA